MNAHSILNLSDARLAPFRDLRTTQSERERFVVEGPVLTQRLLESDYEVESLLVSPNHVHRLQDCVGDAGDVLVLENESIRQLVGFPFHRGMLACARRKSNPPLTDLVREQSERQTIVACPLLRDDANLGGIVRVAAAFGATGLLLGPHCADPFSRRSLRAGMGAQLGISIRRSDAPLEELTWLMDQDGFESVATVLDSQAESVAGATVSDRLVLVVGSEYDGMEGEWIERCTRRLTIPMQSGIDSLNVTVATGIVLHQLRGWR